MEELKSKPTSLEIKMRPLIKKDDKLHINNENNDKEEYM